MMNYCEHGVHKNSCALCKITNMTSKTYKKIQVEFVGFCSEGKGGKTRLECAKWIADKFSTLLEEKIKRIDGLKKTFKELYPKLNPDDYTTDFTIQIIEKNGYNRGVKDSLSILREE